MAERRVFLGWSVICGEEGVRYHSQVTSLRGKQHGLSAEAADKETEQRDLALKHTLVHPRRHDYTLRTAHNHIHRMQLHSQILRKPSDMLKDHIRRCSERHRWPKRAFPLRWGTDTTWIWKTLSPNRFPLSIHLCSIVAQEGVNASRADGRREHLITLTPCKHATHRLYAPRCWRRFLHSDTFGVFDETFCSLLPLFMLNTHRHEHRHTTTRKHAWTESFARLAAVMLNETPLTCKWCFVEQFDHTNSHCS